MKLDASVVGPGIRTHYVDHLAPIWKALPEDRRGTFYAGPREAEYASTYGIEAAVCRDTREAVTRMIVGDQESPVLVASHADPQMTDMAGRPNIIAMHGVGFTFGGGHDCYPGTTKHRANTRLILATNETVAEIERAANPHVAVAVVGCPKLDRWVGTRPANPRPVVALAFHWRCGVHRASGTAWDDFKAAIPALAERHAVIGHGHPRIIDELAPWYESHGIEVVRDQAEVFDRADLLMADATSCAFEAAALDRPVVLLDGARQRRAAGECGGMYADRTSLGVVCYRAADLVRCADLALSDPPGIAEARRSTAARCYANIGTATDAAVSAILECLGGVK